MGWHIARQIDDITRYKKRIRLKNQKAFYGLISVIIWSVFIIILIKAA